MFGTELRRRRQAAGLSLADLADLVHYSKGYLSKIEAGTKPPAQAIARRCDMALGAEGGLVALAAHGAQLKPGPESELVTEYEEEEVWSMSLSADGTSRFTLLNRRDATRAVGGALTGLNTSIQRSLSPIGEEALLTSAMTLFGHLRQLGQVAGSGVVLPSVITQAHVVRGLAAHAQGGMQRVRLLLLAAQHAEFAGWLAQEAGDDRCAMWWTEVAVQMASAAGDRDMAAHALVRRALVALYRDDAYTTIALARRAQEDPAVSTRVRALAALREAQGHALAGNPAECERLLDQGESLLAGVSAPEAPGMSLGPALGGDPVVLARGWCYYDLGRPEEAVTILAPEVAKISAASLRARTRFGMRLALACAASGHIDQACQLAWEMTEAAAGVDSATIRTDVARLARALARWHTRPAVAEVYPRLVMALRGTAAT